MVHGVNKHGHTHKKRSLGKFEATVAMGLGAAAGYKASGAALLVKDYKFAKNIVKGGKDAYLSKKMDATLAEELVKPNEYTAHNIKATMLDSNRSFDFLAKFAKENKSKVRNTKAAFMAVGAAVVLGLAALTKLIFSGKNEKISKED